MTKQTLRRELIARRNAIPARDKHAFDEALNTVVIAHPSFQQASTVLGFVPIGSEPDITPVLEEALRLGKALYLPCCEPNTRTMTFRQVSSLSELIPGAHGIPGPPKNNSAFSIQHSALCLVPGLAFNDAGFRLGYGGGYYDRFLANFQGTAMGICYAAMRQAVPQDAYDCAVDIVISEM